MLLKKIDCFLCYILIPLAYFLRLLFLYKKKSKKTLIVRPGGMGDLVTLTHAVKKLKLKLDDYDFLIEKRSEHWARYLNLNYVCYDDRPIRTLFSLSSKYLKVINSEQRYGLSQIYSVSCLGLGGTITTFSSNRLSFLSNIIIPYNNTAVHEIESFFNILKPNHLKKQLITKAINDQSSYCLLWIAGNSSKSRTMSPYDYRELASNLNFEKIYIIFSPQDEWLALQVNNQLKDLFHVCEIFRGSFQDACHLLRGAGLLMSVDSAPVHIASYFSIKSYTIFTSGIIQKWHPLVEGSMIYRNPNAHCSPCTLFGHTPACSNSYLCKEINFKAGFKVEELKNIVFFKSLF
jgi:hypothetical protein